MMSGRAACGLLLAGLLLATARAADPEIARFDGEDSERTAVFESPGPWMLDWTASSDEDLPVIFELRLIDADSGEFIGPIVERQRTDQGRRLFEDAGRFIIQVVAENVRWHLVIRGLGDEQASAIKRRATGEETLQDKSRRAARTIHDNQFKSWRPVDDRTLLLFAADNTHGFRVRFSAPCPGLVTATALSFLGITTGRLDVYDSILLDDGTSCTFDEVIPTVFD